MKSITISRAAIGFAFLALIAGVLYEHATNRRLDSANAEALSAITSSAGRLTTALSALAPDQSSSAQSVAAEVRGALVPLSLVVVTAEVDVSSMSADSFAGLCMLVTHADRLFPSTSGNPVDQQVNRLLITRLQGLQAAIRNESAARLLRFGDRHKCELQGAGLSKQ